MKRKKTLVLEESFSDHISRGRPRYKSGRPFFVGTTPILIGKTLFRRDDKIRTCDPLHPMQVRYRAALRPEI